MPTSPTTTDRSHGVDGATPSRRRLLDELVDLAAMREPADLVLSPELIAVAVEHRMAGLLWTWASANAPESDERSELAVRDLRMQAHQARVAAVLRDCLERFDAVGIDVATIKGVTAEERWYGRRGERPCSDVDLWLSPHQLDRAAEAVAAIDPAHPWLDHLPDLVGKAGIQTVTLRHERGVEVDLHFDLLKLGVRTLQADEMWRRTTVIDSGCAGRVRVLDETTALLQLLTHLNKDRFQRLLGYADIPRVIATDRIDWPAFVRLVRGEGLDVPVGCTLDVVVRRLGVPWPDAVERPAGLEPAIWRAVWPDRIRLRGREGRLRYRRRQDVIALLARGRRLAAVGNAMRELVPPSPAVHARYGDIDGPYLWRLTVGRVEAWRAHRRAVLAMRSRGRDAEGAA